MRNLGESPQPFAASLQGEWISRPREICVSASYQHQASSESLSASVRQEGAPVLEPLQRPVCYAAAVC